mmetsp:Transcript_26459/g.56452  ORF Transcript_26459/g.56452 Transcript_26459/m.56452 type:complete len:218 (-) Transcript_26459:55-708(-)
MNKSFYHRKKLLQVADAEGVTSQFKQMIFATGNCFYPGIRKSLPIYLVNGAIKSFGLEWTDEGRILRVETPGASFIKPKLWEDRFYSGLIKEAMERTATRSFSDVTIITHSENLPIGSSVSGVGEADDDLYPQINRFVRELLSDKFNWTCYGVAPKEGLPNYCIQDIPSVLLKAYPDEFDALFLDCKIPYRDMDVVDNLLLAPLQSQWYNSYLTRQQ